MMWDITRKISPELAELIKLEQVLKMKAFKEALYTKSPIWKALMDASKTDQGVQEP